MNDKLKIKSFFIFVIIGYERRLEDGTLSDIISFELIAKDKKEALKKAKKIIKKPFYRISQVIEKEII